MEDEKGEEVEDQKVELGTESRQGRSYGKERLLAQSIDNDSQSEGAESL